jgi:hypothetical protein
METLSFRDWSHWFEEALTDYHRERPERGGEWERFGKLRPHVIALMGWIVSAADSVGTGFSSRGTKSIGHEIGASASVVEECFEALARVGLLDLCEDHPTGRPCLQVTLSRAGGPEDSARLERLIAALPWNGGDL